MKKYIFIPILISVLFVSCTQPMKYPETKKVDTTNVYFGTSIADPYRWLEDDNSDETAEWVKAQNTLTFDYLSKIPYREKVKERLTKIWNYEKIGTPWKKGNYYFFFKNDGVQNQSVLYYQEGISGTPKVLIDPNTLSADGTVALNGTAVSKDAKYMAYQVSKAGSDWAEINILDLATGTKLADQLNWIKFSGMSWKGDGFYYSHYDAPVEGTELSKKNEFQKVYYHKIGDTQDKDVLVHEDKEHPQRTFGAEVTEDEHFLIISESESTSGNNLRVKDLNAKDGDFKIIVSNFDNDYGVIDNIGDELLVMTNYEGPKYKLVLINPAKPESANWTTILPESTDLLEGVWLSGDKIIAKYLKDVTSRLHVYDLQGKKEREIQLPGLGVAGSLSADRKDSIVFYSFTNFVMPNTIYKYNMNSNVSEVYFAPHVDFKSDEYESKQVFYTSKDGTKIPMFITHKKGLKMDGNNPTFLYGYGGFNINITPSFSTDKVLLLENGGIYAVANMRGGGEYGEDWHKAGTKCSKQNVFDDFIAAAEYLIKEKYTSSEKLAIHGRSNGGLLVGAVMTQRPDLAKVAIPGVGVLDMLRYQKFTIGWAWATDYGTSDNKEEFDCLIKYSPLHNVKKVEYPATMVITGDHDDRVVPAHSFKFAATLQENQQGKNPTLVRIDVKAGHGAGKPTAKQIEEWADIWSFIFYNLGVEPKY